MRNAFAVWEFITKLRFNLEKILHHEILLVVLVRYLFFVTFKADLIFFQFSFLLFLIHAEPISWFCIHRLCNDQGWAVFYNNRHRQRNKLHCS